MKEASGKTANSMYSIKDRISKKSKEIQFWHHTIKSALFRGVSEESANFNLMMKRGRNKIMKRLLFEDSDSNSLHLLPSRSVFLAPDRLAEKRDKRDSPCMKIELQVGKQ